MASVTSTVPSVSDALKFVAFSSSVKVEFWTELAARKLDTYRLNDDAKPIVGVYGSGQDTRAPCRLSLLGEQSFAAERGDARSGAGPGARFQECRALGYIKNVNTKEAFKDLDKRATLAAIASEIWDDAMESGRAVAEPERLLRFLLITFADLKKSAFLYWFAFPTLGGQGLFRLASQPVPASSLLKSPAEIASVIHGLSALWARSVESTGRPGCPPFFVISRAGHGRDRDGQDQQLGDSVRVMSLLEFEAERGGTDNSEDGGEKARGATTLFGFVDPSSDAGGTPGWPLRNFLALLSARWGLKRASVLCFRDFLPRRAAAAAGKEGSGALSYVSGVNESNLDRSVVLDVDLLSAPSTKQGDLEAAKSAWLPDRIGSIGWEPNAGGKLGPRMADLSSVLDPARLAENSVRLNIKLMRWRALPTLDVDLLSQTRCLLLGAGTLGCAVARCLLGWGVQNISFADNGRVAYSNPVRQSLFNFEDCKGGGRFKAEAAASTLGAIYPGVKSHGHILTIPMPGHPLATDAEVAAAKRDTKTLEDLVSSHDVVFVLTDSRESRWLPTLLSAKYDKICINAALGLDSFLVVRHGGSPAADGGASSSIDKAEPNVAMAAGAGAALARPAEAPTSPAKSEGSTHSLRAAAVVDATAASIFPPRLGCYFCTDVVAPENSSLNRTLDQQCTVTRPGLAPMAAATAVEMTVGLLHHPLRQRAPADDSAERAKVLGATQAAAAAGDGGQPLGALPHQVRGFIATFTSVTPSAAAFDRCTACSAAVVAAYESEGWGFVEKACRSPQVLEEVSGLEEMRRGLDAVDVDLDWGGEEEWDDERA